MRTSGRRRRNRENQERVAVSALADVGVVGGRGDRGPVEKGLRGPVVAGAGGDTVYEVSRFHIIGSGNAQLTLVRILLSTEPLAKAFALATHGKFTARRRLGCRYLRTAQIQVGWSVIPVEHARLDRLTSGLLPRHGRT